MTASTEPDPVFAARAALGVAARRGRDQAPARRDLTAAKLRRAIQQALADEHPLSTAERVELADMLAGDER